MKELTGHRITPVNDRLTIEATDKAGFGGAHHAYLISGYTVDGNPSKDGLEDQSLRILFQNGTVTDKGCNGVTNESLLEVVIDRLRSFEAGPHACREYNNALTSLETAKFWLQERTLERAARGVGDLPKK